MSASDTLPPYASLRSLTPSEMTMQQYVRYCAECGFPWCDICELPVVLKEGSGILHSTPQYPSGIPRHKDTATHRPTIRQWRNCDFGV